MRCLRRVGLLVGAVCAMTALSATTQAQTPPEWLERTTLSGYVFGDAYHFSSDDEDVDGENGFWFRRMYLTIDSELSESLSARLRFEVNSPGDFTTSTNLEPYVKSAYLRWSSSGRDLYVGLTDTPTWGTVEDVWGYRFVEKTPLDLHRLGTSADVGVALQGAFDGESNRFRYNVMLGNGSGTRSETDSGKKAMLSTGWYPDDHWILEAYGDVESRPGATDRRTVQLFGAYQTQGFRVGLQAARQRQEVSLDDTRDVDLASAFAVLALSQRVNLLLRYDVLFDPSPEGDRIAYLPFDPTADSQLAIVGIDVALHERVNLTPNVEAIFYDRDDGDPRPEPDETLAARLTLYWRF